MYKIVFTEQARRALKRLKLSGLQKKLMMKAIDSLATNPYHGFALRRELKGFYKLRVGDYRIIYDVKRETVTVIIIADGHRKNIYEILARRAKMI